MPVYQGVGVDDEAVHEGQQALISYFQAKGYFDRSITPGYFALLHIPLNGRDFTEQDLTHTLRVAIINRAAAELWFPGQNPIGRRLLTSPTDSNPATIVGIAATPDAESLVRSVKQQLSALGYQTGVPGSALTPEFARAIREFETDQKLKVSGRISGPMESRLLRLQSEPKARREAIAKASKR